MVQLSGSLVAARLPSRNLADVRVFLSWSTPTSRAVAEALHDWLPNVVQEVEPWLSSADITPGVRWPLEVGRHLEASDFGILCLTVSNLAAPWILFEAGALGKKLETARVVPYLFRVAREEVTGPLSQFQNVESTEEGTRGMVNAIHASIEAPALSRERLSRAFDKWWPDLQQRLTAIPEAEPVAPSMQRPAGDVLAEVLNIVRGLQRDSAIDSAPWLSIDGLAARKRAARRAENRASVAGSEPVKRFSDIVLEGAKAGLSADTIYELAMRHIGLSSTAPENKSQAAGPSLDTVPSSPGLGCGGEDT